MKAGGGNRVANKVRRINQRQGAKTKRRINRVANANERIDEGNERRANRAISKGKVKTETTTIKTPGKKGTPGTPGLPFPQCCKATDDPCYENENPRLC